MTNPDRKLRVFLCHASQDKPVVRELYQQLNAEGWIDPWLDEERLFPGQDWNLEIEKAVEIADAVVVFLSTNSVTKEGYIQKELRKVLDVTDEKPEGTIFIIPLRLDACEPPHRLGRWQYVDYFPSDHEDSAYLRILDSLKIRAEFKISFEKTNASSMGDEREIIDTTEAIALSDLNTFVWKVPAWEINLGKESDQQALRTARSAYERGHLNTSIMLYEGMIVQNVQLGDVINDLVNILQIHPSNFQVWRVLGKAYENAGLLEQADRAQLMVQEIRSANDR